ncbi:MAG: hypothetical protein COY58_09755 [Gammaproteobacteria bacterium CG_4_10_14_0_8_um_filter_38_16]|nr:MAG: hypothetical protein COY58_09755 [Gammaproteobacteria bacterium CG_4_10_14_0_8_um_filter_38_16]PJA03032.1 MAG: hypothetical protein COX72_06910 [Gammaproteobacteria bacterium CG_4_10_14_0_2_um_filter_38_22]PJB10238.1 MAG: hypothetical protein CO120_06005 [Gammaproteobacteria bacterium CG_4_9_14_3_um_filter_38_9]
MGSQKNRIDALDNLRAILALIGIPFHAAFFLMLAIAQSRHIFFRLINGNVLIHISKQYHYFFLLIFYVHTFRMPAFFLLAGFFAHLLYSSRGTKRLLKNRFLRIGLPFLFYFIWIMPLYLAQLWAMSLQQGKSFDSVFHVSYQNGVLWSYVDNLDNYWFLYYLLIFYAMLLLFLFAQYYRWIPVVFSQKIGIFFEKILFPPFIYVVLPVLFALIFIKAQFWYVVLDERLLPSIYLILLYGVWFLMGWFLWVHKNAFVSYMHFAWQKIVLSFLCYLTYLYFYVHFLNAHNTIMYVCAVFLYTISMTLGVLGVLGFAWHYFSRFNRVLKYFSKASYWIYLTQVPIVFFLVQLMRALTHSFYLQFFSATILCGLICTLSYHFLIRKTRLQSIVG